MRISMENLPEACAECGVSIPMYFNNDPKKIRYEPLSHYWSEAKQLSFCGPKHSLVNYERDRLTSETP